MTITLHPLSPADLRALASSAIPVGMTRRVAAGALPPAFVAERSLQQIAGGKSPHWCSTFLILLGTEQMVVGACGFKDIPAAGSVEIGYGVAPCCRNQGIATAAVQDMLRFAFDSAEVNQVTADINPDNTASTRLVQSLGFVAGATIVDEDGELLVQWIKSRPPVD